MWILANLSNPALLFVKFLCMSVLMLSSSRVNNAPGRGKPLGNRVQKRSQLITQIAKQGLDYRKISRQIRDVEHMHCILGHQDMAKVSHLKKHGKVIASEIFARV